MCRVGELYIFRGGSRYIYALIIVFKVYLMFFIFVFESKNAIYMFIFLWVCRFTLYVCIIKTGLWTDDGIKLSGDAASGESLDEKYMLLHLSLF